MVLHGLDCFNDWCNWKPSISDQILYQEEITKRKEDYAKTKDSYAKME